MPGMIFFYLALYCKSFLHWTRHSPSSNNVCLDGGWYSFGSPVDIVLESSCCPYVLMSARSPAVLVLRLYGSSLCEELNHKPARPAWKVL